MTAHDSSTPRRTYKWEMLALLWFCFFLHQGDRQVFNALIPLMREGLSLTDTQLGLVATIFTIAYGVLVPFAGYAGDVFQKRHVVMISLLTFSLGTLLTGFAGGIITLILFRSIAATGLMLGFAFVVGGTAPVILGWIKDTSGMENGMSLLAYVFAGGGLILLVSRLLTFKKDYIAEE